jgi:hypothetical protein
MTISSADLRRSKHLTQRELIAELEKLYRGKGLRRDVFGRRAALPSEVAAWVADARRSRTSGQG